ncbi:acyltransferase [Spirosoma sp. KNUC1025]|uniref:acyltransferase n=1 Tax=Spirosoma sp. KNUC1025 TaxID=2894082 RepID=UPI0038632F6E|nr:acyltransferase [Spirosoma sp. KNUC1025]
MRQSLRSLSKAIKAGIVDLQSALIRQKIRLLYPNVVLGRNVRFYGPIELRIEKSATVRIGDNVTFRSATKYNFIGINRPVSIYAGAGATLNIGEGCGFSGTAIVATNSIIFEPFCLLGGNTSVWDTDFHPLDHQLRRVQTAGTKTAPIHIGTDVFVGANVLVMKGVSIGARSIIGAGSVVTRSVPADEIWAGNPVRFIKCHPDSRNAAPLSTKSIAMLA